MVQYGMAWRRAPKPLDPPLHRIAAQKREFVLSDLTAPAFDCILLPSFVCPLPPLLLPCFPVNRFLSPRRSPWVLILLLLQLASLE
jgi:hypothetical protein